MVHWHATLMGRCNFAKHDGKRSNGTFFGYQKNNPKVARILGDDGFFHYCETATLRKPRKVRRAKLFGKVVGKVAML